MIANNLLSEANHANGSGFADTVTLVHLQPVAVKGSRLTVPVGFTRRNMQRFAQMYTAADDSSAVVWLLPPPGDEHR